MGKGGNPAIPGLGDGFALGRPEVVAAGDAVLLLATGAIAANAMAARDLLARDGASAAVAVLAHLGFEGSAELRALLAKYPVVISVEEGYAAGGLGSLVAETIARHGLQCRLHTCGVRSTPDGRSGGAEYLQGLYGLGADAIAADARRLLAASGRA